MSDVNDSAAADAKQKKAAWAEAVTELAEEYAQKLQDIYENRTAGDFTFLGVLAEYTQKMDDLRSKRPTIVNVFNNAASNAGMQFGPSNPGTPPGMTPAMMAKLAQKSRNRA